MLTTRKEIQSKLKVNHHLKNFHATNYESARAGQKEEIKSKKSARKSATLLGSFNTCSDWNRKLIDTEDSRVFISEDEDIQNNFENEYLDSRMLRFGSCTDSFVYKGKIFIKLSLQLVRHFFEAQNV